jgi:hypothetical protein
VKAIGDLLGLRCALPDPLGVRTGAVTADHLQLRVSAQPGGEGVGGAVGQQVDHPPLLQVDQDGAEVAPFPTRPVVDAKHPHRPGGRQGSTADQAQEGAR